MTPTMEARVAAGAEFLDKVKPDWWRDIDVGTLSLNSCAECVLGQLYGGETVVVGDVCFVDGFSVGVAKNKLSNTEIKDYGFSISLRDVADGRGSGGYARAYEKLTDLWISLVKERYERG